MTKLGLTCVGTLATAAVGCSIEVSRSERVVEAEPAVLEAIGDADRIMADIPTESPLRLALLQTPPPTESPYRFANPVAVAALGAPYCRVAVGDPVDRAVHLFTFAGRYVESYDLDPDGVPVISHLTDMWEGPRLGVVTIDDRRTPRRVQLDLTRALSAKARRTSSQSIVARPEDGQVEPRWRIVAAGETLAYLRAHRVDELRAPRSPELHRAMNEMIMVRPTRGDTAWWLRPLDGRIVGVAGSDEVDGIAEMRALPVFFAMSPPRAVSQRVDGVWRTSVQVERHVLAATLDEAGRMVLVQTVRPGAQWALAIVDDREHQVTYRRISRATDVAAEEGRIVVIENDQYATSWSGRRVVAIYANPASDQLGERCGE